MYKSWRAVLRRSKIVLSLARRRWRAGAALVRPLTAGEVALVRLVFGDAIAYQRVRIHNRCYLPFGLQPVNCAMSPNGHVYFHPRRFVPDFSVESHRLQHWFMHEMTHVWQHQLGYPVRCRGALRLGLDYAYRLAPGKRLCHYNMEAQGDLLADYFALKFLADTSVMAQPRYGADLDRFELTLCDFNAARCNRSHLPAPWWRAGANQSD